MDKDIVVSIICNAYNQEEYIRDALDSFLFQKTNFEYEILVHDDASTDNTAKIIREYEEKYPNIVKPIYQIENQYSKPGVSVTRDFQLPRVKGKYIALCEGDDYWTDPLKLQKQVDALNTHLEVDICAHSANLVKADTKEQIRVIAPKNIDCILTVNEVIKNDGGYVATNSLMYRASLNDYMPEFRKYIGLDYTLQIHGSLRGGMLYLKDNMSAYRYMAKGSWTLKNEADPNRKFRFWERMQVMLDLLNKETDYKYSYEILYVKMMQVKELCLDKKEYNKNFLKVYKEVFRDLDFIMKCKILCTVYMPKLISCKRRITSYLQNKISNK